MSFAAAMSVLACLCLAAGLCAAHWRFTQKTADLAALPLLCGGALGALAVIGHDGWSELSAPQLPPLHTVLAPLLVGVAGAASIRLRQLVWGIPAALAIDAGPSNGTLHALIESRSASFHAAAIDAERVRVARHQQLAANIDSLRRQIEAQSRSHAERHHALLATSASMSQALATFNEQQERQTHATLMAALGGLLADFDQRINGQFQQHLTTLGVSVTSNSAVLEKHRLQQAEMMHHARREADQMTRTTTEFRALVEQSAALAALCQQVQQTLDLLGPRHDALDAGIADLRQSATQASEGVGALHAQSDAALDQFVAHSKRAVEGVGQRVGQHVGELQLALQRSAEQARNHAAELAGKHQQQMSAMNKELSETLAKLLAAMNKQLTGMQSKLATDLAPMAQQIRRVADLSKGIK